MLSCINKNLAEYQTLKQRSGLSDFVLEANCRNFMDKYGRFPHLDELPNANSEISLRQELGVNQYGGISISDLLEKTNTNSIEEANAYLNNEYRDLEVNITPLNTSALIDITKRPVKNNFNKVNIETDNNPDSFQVFESLLYKLANNYGIQFKDVTDEELNSERWNGLIDDVSAVNGFIYQGDIYINIDRQSLDVPVHEIMHLLVGQMRFMDPVLYKRLVNLSEQFPNYQKLQRQYPNRSRNDVNEEIFVTEVAKLITGRPSNLANLQPNLQYEIQYNLRRALDTILMGQNSVDTITDPYNQSIKQLLPKVGSTLIANSRTFVDSELHRKLNNIKSDLIKQKQLEEYCD